VSTATIQSDLVTSGAEPSLECLGNAFRKNPFDFFKETDVACFLYSELKLAFPSRVPVVMADGIEQFQAFQDPQRMTCGRVHTEVKGAKDDCRIDLVVLEERRQLVHPKSKRMVGKFGPPFHIGIELKLAYGSRSSRFSGIPSGGGLSADIVKLACLNDLFAHRYVVVVDFFEGRRLTELRQAVTMCKSVPVFYAGLDRSEMIVP
jgi:hypothetical protein